MAVEILALLDREALKRFRIAVERTRDFRSVVLATLHAQLADSHAKLVVIDPSQLRPAEFASFIRTARALQNVAVLVYAELTRETARAVVEASHLLPVEVVFFGSYDERDALAQACEHLLVPSVSALILSALAAKIASLPPPLAVQIVGLFGGQPTPASAEEFVASTHTEAATVRRGLRRAGLRGAKRLLDVTRVARTWEALSTGSKTFHKVLDQHGFDSRRAFDDNFQRLVGRSPFASRDLRADAVAQRLLAVLRR